ncbi:MAG TPA: cytochrome D1 domain-containing protein [Terriglobales bacterium]
MRILRSILLALSLLWYPMTSPAQTAHGLLLVANKGEHTLSIFDPDSGQQLASVPVGGITGHEVAASPDGKTAWVPIYGNSGVGLPGTDGTTISVIDLNARKQTGTIDLAKPSRPHCAVFNPKDGKLYVTTEITQSLTVIDPARNAIVGTVPTGAQESHMLAISSDGKRGYTANVGPGTVSVIDLQKKEVLARIDVAKKIQRIAISQDDRWVFTADQAKPELAVIDTQTNTVKTRIPLAASGYGMAATYDGKWLLVALPGSNSVSLIDLKTMKVEKTISVPAAPQEILIRPDDRVAYVSCDQSKQVVAIDLGTFKVTKTFNAGAGADGLAWAGRP